MRVRSSKRLVIKVGTNTLTGGEDHLSRPQMSGIARQIARLVRDGHQVALVSSGAIVAGRQALKLSPERARISRSSRCWRQSARPG